MRYRSFALVSGAAIVALVALVLHHDSDDVVVGLPPPPACEPDAADLNPDNRRIAPSRGKPLVERRGGHMPFGFNDSAYLVGELTLDRTLELDHAAGATLWRLPLDWGAVEREPGELDFSRYDEIYCAAVRAGVSPVFHLTGIPAWAAPSGECPDPCLRPPEDEHLPALRRFAEITAIRYPRAAAIEVWNEPNLPVFWGGLADPAKYLPLLEAIYGGVKDGNPGMPVIGGVLSNNPTDIADKLSLGTYLAGMLEGGAARYMDGFSLHAYPIQPLGTEGEQFTPPLELSRELLDRAAAGIRIWVTEVGAPTAPGAFHPEVSLAGQAALMSGVYRRLDEDGGADAVLFHTLVDPGPLVPGGPGFGFFTAPDASGTVTTKPVVCAVRLASGQDGDCPPAVAP